MSKNSKICINKSTVFFSLVGVGALLLVFLFNNFSSTKLSYKSKASEPTYKAQFDMVTGHTYVTDGDSAILAVVQPPKNWVDARGWTVFVPWTGRDPRKPDAPGGACFLKMDGATTDESISLTFESIASFKVSLAQSSSNRLIPNGTEKCLLDRSTGNALIVRDGIILAVMPPPVYVRNMMAKKIFVSVPWHSQGRVDNFDRPIGGFTVTTNMGTDATKTYSGDLTLGYQASKK